MRAGSPILIEDQVQIRSRDLFADIVLDRLEYLFGALNAGAGRGTDMQLNEAASTPGKKSVPTKRNKTLPPITTKPATAGVDNPPPQNAGKQPAIEIAETISNRALKPAWKRDSQPVSMFRRSCSLRNSRPIMMRRERPRNAIGGEHGKHHRHR